VLRVKLIVLPPLSSRKPSPLRSCQPRLASRRLASSGLKSYLTMSGEYHNLLLGVDVDQFLTASPKKMLVIRASRSTAIDTARRNAGLLNQPYFTGSTCGSPTRLP